MVEKKKSNNTIRKTIGYIVLIFVVAGLSFVSIAFPLTRVFTDSTIDEGEVTTQDIVAPYALSYTSETLTEQQRELASVSVAPIYTAADTSIARNQLERLHNALNYITSVRGDQFASPEQKLNDMAALADISLDQETATAILELSDARWQVVQQEAVVVLEQVMRSTIRENRVEEARRGVPNLVSLALPENQAQIVAQLAAGFVGANSFYSETLTEAARASAVEAVQPVTVAYAAGETIVGSGHVVTDVDMEALQKYGLAEPVRSWEESAGAAAIVVIALSLAILFFHQNKDLAERQGGLILTVILFIVFLYGARVTFPLQAQIPYLFPLSAFALTIAAILSPQAAVILSIPLVLLSVYQMPNTLELFLYHGIGSIFGILIPRREQRISAYIWVGLTIALSSVITVMALRLPATTLDWTDIAILFAAALINGLVAAGMSIMFQYFFSPVLGQITPLHLLELSRPDNPVLEYLLRTAPGTYQHSLQVANLAEQAAEFIDADSLLTRVGALYHDIGKSMNPGFFIENQIHGIIDTHDEMEPEEAAQNIISHVTDGVEMAKEYKLPKRIIDFILEHHGTMRTFYQYTAALNRVGGDESKVDAALFTYPGPRPQSRETALVMLADGCEARVRAQKPKNEQELYEIVRDTIESRVSIGQLDETKFTLASLTVVIDSFVKTLRGISHHRVEYPKLAEPPGDAALMKQTLPSFKTGSFSAPTLIMPPRDGNGEEREITHEEEISESEP